MTTEKSAVSSKISDYQTFLKIRLATLVVFSAAITYMLASGDQFSWSVLGWVVLGGFLVTGSSNGFNQIWEKESDKLMSRTQDRPLPKSRMKVREGFVLAFIVGIIGSVILFRINFLTGVLGLASLLSYATVYTPMKKVSSWAVFVGAFPGAMPPLIGWVAFTGEFTPAALSLFALQFMWQFPHFWAIAWRSHEDYKRAGFHLLPSIDGKDKRSAMQIFLYTVFMVPISLLPLLPQFGPVGGWFSALVLLLSSIIMLYPAWMLFKTMDDKWATKLMFASFIYLPIVLLAFLFDQLLILH